MPQVRLLCIDDDPAARAVYTNMLTRHGYEVIMSAGADFVPELNAGSIDAVVLAFETSSRRGGQFAADIKRRQPRLPVIMVSDCKAVIEDAGRFVDGAVGKNTASHDLLMQLRLLNVV
ncbi:MAG TPA: response regulator [Terriglobales bacterium]|nr:response regulator [Terriglobales bacterium]